MTGDASEEQAARLAREVTVRAIRRLDVLEWLILAGAMLAATLGGALVAVVGSATFGWNVRVTWVVASVLLFGVPGAVVLRNIRREERASRDRLQRNEDDHG